MDTSLDMLDNGNGGDFTAPAPVAIGETTEPMAPKPDSPRTVWFRENRIKLEEKEAKEKEAKDKLMADAKSYMESFYAERQTRVETTKRANREDEKKALELQEKPEGTMWEQIIHMIDFNLGVQQKDVTRARSLLFQAKDANLPVQ